MKLKKEKEKYVVMGIRDVSRKELLQKLKKKKWGSYKRHGWLHEQ